MRLLLFILLIPTVAGAQLRGQSKEVTTFAVGLELVPTKTAYAVMTFGVKFREGKIVMPARLLYRGDLKNNERNRTNNKWVKEGQHNNQQR